MGLTCGVRTGKTSVVNLASERLRTDLDINVVHVSADKHSGHARSRNIVHTIAGELVDEALLKEHEVNEHLQWLRSSARLAAPAPEEIRLATMTTNTPAQTLHPIRATQSAPGVLLQVTPLASLCF